MIGALKVIPIDVITFLDCSFLLIKDRATDVKKQLQRTGTRVMALCLATRSTRWNFFFYVVTVQTRLIYFVDDDTVAKLE